MGGDIAAWCALRGLTVTMQDQSPERLKPAIQRAGKLFADRLKDRRRVRDAFDRLIPDVAGDGAARADVIIEAIFENLDAKRELFVALEAKAKPSALLATNTSSIPIEQIATAMRERVVLVDAPAVEAFCRREAAMARDAGDGHRAWVVRDALPKLAPLPMWEVLPPADVFRIFDSLVDKIRMSRPSAPQA